MARRVHYILQYDETSKKAVGACKTVDGLVEFVGPYTKATCPNCISLLMNRKIKKTVTINEKVREIAL